MAKLELVAMDFEQRVNEMYRYRLVECLLSAQITEERFLLEYKATLDDDIVYIRYEGDDESGGVYTRQADERFWDYKEHISVEDSNSMYAKLRDGLGW